MAQTRHTLSVLVEDKPGVLARVAALFSRRGFNIESLAVGPTEHAAISRMTIVVAVEDSPLEQVTKQLNKLVNVIKIVQLEPGHGVERELVLVKVRADVDATIEKAMAVDDMPVVVDFVVGQDAMVWPMVPAGTSNDEILAARDTRPVWDANDV